MFRIPVQSFSLSGSLIKKKYPGSLRPGLIKPNNDKKENQKPPCHFAFISAALLCRHLSNSSSTLAAALSANQKMPRPYAVKGRKRRKKEEKYDREESVELPSEDEAERGGSDAEREDEEEKSGDGSDEKVAEDDADELPGIPIVPGDEKKKGGVIFILEKASLEVAKVGKSYQILSSEEHTNFLRKNNKNPADYRPDIVHQALLTILDSPINKAGRVQAVYVETEKGVLFEVKPFVRIPRTYKRFAGIMLQLLQKLSISAVGKREKLFRVIKNPVTRYLPLNSRKIGFSFSSEKLIKIQDYVNAVKDDTTLVFMVGAMAHGKIGKEMADDYISISEYPLSAAWCIAKIGEAMANKWSIV